MIKKRSELVIAILLTLVIIFFGFFAVDGGITGAVVGTDNIGTLVAPSISNLVINSSLGNNTTSENLTLYWDISGGEGNWVKNITNWLLNGSSIAVLNMPFENISTPTAGQVNATKDYSGYQNNGSEHGGPTFNATGGYDGRGAFEFDGAGDYIDLGTESVLNITSNITIMAWIKMNSYSNYRRILGWENESGNSAWVILLANDATRIGVAMNQADGTTLSNYGGDISDKKFHHVAGTYDGSTLYIYVDGSSIGSATGTNQDLLEPVGTTIRIGKTYTNGFDGTIDDVMIFNRSLSEKQIKTIYDNKIYIISSEETSAGDNWSACITPNDGTQDGTMVCSGNLTIIQVIPEVESFINTTDPLNKTTGYLVGYWNTYIADKWGSEQSNETQWYNTSVWVSGLDNLTEVNYSNTTAGENWTFSVRVYDGTNWSRWVNSSVSSILLTCNNNRICESNLEEDTTNCPYDCNASSLLPTAPDGKEWRLNWSDEFDGAILDTNYWSTINWSSGADYSSDEAIYVDGIGNLIMDSFKNDTGTYANTISTLNKYERRYGYFEARMSNCAYPGRRTPSTCSATFWLRPNTTYYRAVGDEGRDGSEIDIFESGVYDNLASHALHWDILGGYLHSTSKKPVIPGLLTGYHTHAVFWTPEEYVFYIDGVETWRLSFGGVCKNIVEILLGNGPNIYSEDDTFFPMRTYVDYVRIYDLCDINGDCDYESDYFIADDYYTSLIGTWTVDTFNNSHGNNNSYISAGTGANTATWLLNGSGWYTTPNITRHNVNGSYKLQAMWKNDTDRATNAKYTVNHRSGSTIVSVNQTLNGGTWVDLGTYTLNITSNITLSDDADGIVVADAIKGNLICDFDDVCDLRENTTGCSADCPSTTTQTGSASTGSSSGDSAVCVVGIIKCIDNNTYQECIKNGTINSWSGTKKVSSRRLCEFGEFVDKEVEEIITKHPYQESALLMLEETTILLEKAKEKGLDVREAENFLVEAKLLYEHSNYQEALRLSEKVKGMLEELLTKRERKPSFWKRLRNLFGWAVGSAKDVSKDYSKYWMFGIINLLIIAGGIYFVSRLLKRNKKHKRVVRKRKPIVKKHHKNKKYKVHLFRSLILKTKTLFSKFKSLFQKTNSERLKDYLKECKKSSMTKKQIKSSLRKKGWPENIVKKLNIKKKKGNIQLGVLIFIGFILALVFALSYTGGNITGAVIGIESDLGIMAIPNITFVTPTDSDGAIVNRNYTYINVTFGDSDGDNLTAFINWDYSLVGWWRLNENSTTDNATDFSSYENNGTITNFDYTDISNWTVGKFGSGLLFDGVNDVVRVNDDASLRPADALTVMAWIKNANSANIEIINYRSTTPLYYSLYAIRDEAVTINLDNGTGNGKDIYAAFNSVSGSSWQHVALTFSRTDQELRAYVDGVLQSSSPVATGGDYPLYVNNSGIDNLYLGAATTTLRNFNGTIDDVMIFNRTLTAEEINASY
ncbi:LamG-like jellyroll fold domain-containing protein, partial [Nanoarchaeota archaeon]